MKKIIFVRHGKAEDHVQHLSDYERSLTIRGKNISRQIAKKLKEKEKDIGLIVTSPAFRAIETALIFCAEYGMNPDNIVINSDLYFKIDDKSFFSILKSVNDETNTIILFGHNPSFTELADYFCLESCDTIPKSGIVCLSFRTKTWSSLIGESGKLEFFLKPKSAL